MSAVQKVLVHLKSGQTVEVRVGFGGHFHVKHRNGEATGFSYENISSHSELFIDPSQIAAVEWVK